MEEYISIKEFSDIVGLSRQSVYKKVDNILKQFTKTENGKKLISIKALEVFEKDKLSTEFTDEFTKVVNTLTAQLEVKDRQILEKDKQIAEKDKQISELTTALINEQHSAQQAHALHAGTMQQKAIESKSTRVNFFVKWFTKSKTN